MTEFPERTAPAAIVFACATEANRRTFIRSMRTPERTERDDVARAQDRWPPNIRRHRRLRDRGNRPQSRGPPGTGRGAVPAGCRRGSTRCQTAEAGQPFAVHQGHVQRALHRAQQLRPDLRPAPGGARIRPCRVPAPRRCRRRAGHRLRFHRLRPAQRRLPGRRRPTGDQDRVSGRDQHAPAGVRGQGRQAADPEHRRRDDGRGPPGLRHDPAAEHEPRAVAVHRRVPGCPVRPPPLGDHHLPRGVPRHRDRLLRSRPGPGTQLGRVHPGGPGDREALHAGPLAARQRPPLLPRRPPTCRPDGGSAAYPRGTGRSGQAVQRQRGPGRPEDGQEAVAARTRRPGTSSPSRTSPGSRRATA